MKHFVLATCYDKRGRVLARRANSYGKTHPVQAHFARLAGQPDRQFLHAEIHALLAAGERPVYRIHIERYNSKGEPVLAAPCGVCQLALKSYGVKKVTHT